jgi:8-oxo-dGTP diphosphatase
LLAAFLPRRYRISIRVFAFAWELDVARVAVLAAGGIVLRREQPPRIAVVRLRKRDEWVLPKGKLDQGETPRAAAKREVLEETGHNVTLYEFLGTLVYECGGRSKVVHYWSMEANGEKSRELMSDVREVDWLPLNAALERLSRSHERAFLETVGPLAVNGFLRRLKAKPPVLQEAAVKAPARKRRRPVVSTPEPAGVELAPLPPVHPHLMPPEALTEQSRDPAVEALAVEPLAVAEIAAPALEADSCATSKPMTGGDDEAAVPAHGQRRSLAQKVRDWLGRAA